MLGSSSWFSGGGAPPWTSGVATAAEIVIAATCLAIGIWMRKGSFAEAWRNSAQRVLLPAFLVALGCAQAFAVLLRFGIPGSLETIAKFGAAGAGLATLTTMLTRRGSTLPARSRNNVLAEWLAERSTNQARIQDLTAEHERLRSAIEASGAGLWDWDLESDVVSWNARTKTLFGMPSQETPGGYAAVVQRVHPQDRDRFEAEVQRARESGASLTQTFRICMHDGSVHTLMASSAVIRDATGKAERMTGFLLDISEQAAAQELFRNAVESAPCGMLLIDERGSILFANGKAGTLFGWEPTELVGRSVEDLVPEARRERHVGLRRDYFRDPSRREMAAGRDLTALRRDGTEVPVEILLSPVQLARGRAVISTIVDVSPRKHAETERRRHAEELERRNRALDEFAYLVSHDLKAPLRAISMVSQWLQADYGDKLGPDGAQHLATLRERAAKMDALIQGALTYARAGREQGVLGEIDTAQVFREVRGLLEVPEGFTVVAATELPKVVYDRDHFAKILLNLLGNAIQHHGKPTGRIEFGAEEAPDHQAFWVRDDGPGIDPKHHERVFRMFERLTTARGTSTGVGLAIVRMLVERHGGRVTLRSAEGEGSTFRFTVPKSPPQRPKEGRSST